MKYIKLTIIIIILNLTVYAPLVYSASISKPSWIILHHPTPNDDYGCDAKCANDTWTGFPSN